MTSDATSIPTPIAAAVVLFGALLVIVALAAAVFHKDEQ